MAIFFFVVGLEIKREVLVGELTSPRRAALPVAAPRRRARPAGIYLAVHAGTPAQEGWAIPMATDIAFASGVLPCSGSASRSGSKSSSALAIVDDIVAVLVIALFYTAEVAWVLPWRPRLVVLVAVNRLGVRTRGSTASLDCPLGGGVRVRGPCDRGRRRFWPHHAGHRAARPVASSPRRLTIGAGGGPRKHLIKRRPP